MFSIISSILLKFSCRGPRFSFDRPSSANMHEDQDKHFYATYDQQSNFLRFIILFSWFIYLLFFLLQRNVISSSNAWSWNNADIVVEKPSPSSKTGTIFFSLVKNKNEEMKSSAIKRFNVLVLSKHKFLVLLYWCFVFVLFFIFYIYNSVLARVIKHIINKKVGH